MLTQILLKKKCQLKLKKKKKNLNIKLQTIAYIIGATENSSLTKQTTTPTILTTSTAQT
jgi:hypothetical protein